jgi:hypothetical protein
MSLVTNLQNLVTSIGTEFKSVKAMISGSGTGNVSGLATTATNLVGAINEVRSTAGNAVTSVNGAAGPGAVVIDSDDVAEGTVNLYHTPARVIAAPLTGYTAGAGTIAATDTVLQGIQKLAGNAAALINDTAASTTSVYSSTKTDGQISAAVAALVASSPAALDTLNEFALALGNDANFAATTATAIGLKANTADVFTKTQLGTDAETHNFAADFATALA